MITFNCLKEIIGSCGLVVIGNEVGNLISNEDVLTVEIEDESHEMIQLSSILSELKLEFGSFKQNKCILLNGLSKVFFRCEFDQSLIEITFQKLKALSDFYEVILCVNLNSDLETNVVRTIDENNPLIIDALFRKQCSFEVPDFMIADDGYYPNDFWFC